MSMPGELRSCGPGRPVLGRMLSAVLGRWLTRQGQRLLAEGHPPMAIWAFDLVGQQINLRGRYEREELDAVWRCLQALDPRPRQLCLDVGANIGNHALFFARHHEQVRAYEPHPRTFQLLALNAQLAGNVQALPLGLSDAPGEAWIDLPPGNAGMASVSGQPGPGRVACRLDTLDAQLQDEPRPVSLIKIDVEGHEARVLRGAAGRLRRDQPVVLLEQAAEAFRDGSTEALDVLRGLGYEVFITLEPWHTGPHRWLNLLRRLLRGEGYRLQWRERLPHQFHSMIVAVPAALAAARPRDTA